MSEWQGSGSSRGPTGFKKVAVFSWGYPFQLFDSGNQVHARPMRKHEYPGVQGGKYLRVIPTPGRVGWRTVRRRTADRILEVRFLLPESVVASSASPAPRREQYVTTIVNILESYGYLGLALALFFEDFGFPLPGETMLIAMGVVASSGRANIFLVAGIAFVVAVAGDNVGYVLGRYGGRAFVRRFGCRLHFRSHYFLPPSRFENIETSFGRYGVWIIVVARFVDVLRQANGIVAGTLETPWRTFLLFNAVGAALWVSVWSGISYSAGQLAGTSAEIEKILLYTLIAVFGVGTIVYLVRRFFFQTGAERQAIRERNRRECAPQPPASPAEPTSQDRMGTVPGSERASRES